MRTAFIGDSFAQYFNNTWLEQLCEQLSLEKVFHRGHLGGAEYYIYESFIDLLKTDEQIDLAVFCHTEPGRLVDNGRHGINFATASESDQLPEQVRTAARQYYIYLYDDRFHRETHDLMLEKIQSLCKERNILQIHIPSFGYPIVGTSGLWVVNGLDSIARVQGDDYFRNSDLRNHFNSDMHHKFADWLAVHARYYMNNRLDYHLVQLNRDDFS